MRSDDIEQLLSHQVTVGDAWEFNLAEVFGYSTQAAIETDQGTVLTTDNKEE